MTIFPLFELSRLQTHGSCNELAFKNSPVESRSKSVKLWNRITSITDHYSKRLRKHNRLRRNLWIEFNSLGFSLFTQNWNGLIHATAHSSGHSFGSCNLIGQKLSLDSLSDAVGVGCKDGDADGECWTWTYTSGNWHIWINQNLQALWFICKQFGNFFVV